MALGDLGGFFTGNAASPGAQRTADEALMWLARGGAAPGARAAATTLARQQGRELAAQATGSPALAARMGARAGTQAAVQAQAQMAGLEQQARSQAMQESQRRVEMERARTGNALGALLNLGGSVAAMAIPGGQVGGVTRLAQTAFGPSLGQTDTSNSPVYSGPQAGQQGRDGGGTGDPRDQYFTDGDSGPQLMYGLSHSMGPGARQPGPAYTDPNLRANSSGALELGAPTTAAQTPLATRQQDMALARPAPQPFDAPSPAGPGQDYLNELERLLRAQGDVASPILSDERFKTGISDGSAGADQFMGNAFGIPGGGTGWGGTFAGTGDIQPNLHARQWSLSRTPGQTSSYDRNAPGMAPLVGAFLSDEDSKEAIREASTAIDQFLSSMNPREFNYRNPRQPGARPGRQLGVMAQDVEQSDIGSQIVQQGPSGERMIDTGGAVSALLAAQARLHDRLSALEGSQQEGLQPGSRMREMTPREFRVTDPPEAALLSGMEREDQLRRNREVPMDVVTGAAQAAPAPRPPTRQQQIDALPPSTARTTSVTLPGRPLPGPGDRVRLPNLEPVPQPSVLDRFLSTVEPYVPQAARGLFR